MVQPVDESVSFVQFAAQAGGLASHKARGPSVCAQALALRGLELVRDLVDLRVEVVEQFPCLRDVGVLVHSRHHPIITRYRAR